MRFLWILLLCFGFLNQALAEDIKESKNNELIEPFKAKTEGDEVVDAEPITIIATRHLHIKNHSYPGMISNLDTKQDKYASNANNLETLLRNHPNLDVIGGPRNSGMQPILRGYSGDGIVVLINGARQNFSPVHNSRFMLDPSLVQDVNVLSGANSSLYGGGALGGVIDFELKSAKDFLKSDKNMGAFVNYGYNSVNSEKFSNLHFFGKSKDEKFDFLVANTGRNTGNSIKLGNGTKLENAKSELFSNLIRANYKPNKENKFGLTWSYSGNKAQELQNPQLTNQDKTSQTALVNKNLENVTLSLTHDYHPESKLVFLKTNLYITQSQLLYNYAQNLGSIKKGDERLRNTTTIGGSVINASELILDDRYKNSLTYGVDFYANNYSSHKIDSGSKTTWNLAPKGQDTLLGLLVQDEISFKESIGSFILVPGVRYDTFTSKATQGSNNYRQSSRFSPKIGLSYFPKNWLMLFSNYVQGFRAPSVDERFAYGQHFLMGPGMSNNFIANPNLKAETNSTIENGFGLDFSNILTEKDSFKFKTSFFYTRANNYIYQNVSFLTTQFENVDRAIIKGLESTLTYNASKLSITASYNYTQGEDSQNNRKLYNLQPQTFKLNSNYSFDNFGTLGARATFASAVSYFDKNTTTNNRRAGYALYDIYYQYKPIYSFLKDATVDVAIDNLFDKTYVRVLSQSIQPGRNYRAGLSYNF
jgi:hemoglobin/transferrin/lactoferrin receptor protein